jgi:phage gpG-like protein
MSGFKFTVTMDPPGGAVKRLNEMAARAGADKRAPMKLVAAQQMRSLAKTFREEGQETDWEKSGRAAMKGGKTLTLTRRLYRSIQFRVTGDRLEIGTSDKRARLLWHGGTVRPKRAKALAIPVDERINRAPREYENTFLLKTPAGKSVGIIMQKIGKRKLKPLFVLRKQVTIPGWKYIEVTAADREHHKKKLGEFYTGEK